MPFSDEYFRLFEDVPAFSERVENKYKIGPDGGRVSERLLRCVWYDRLYDASVLATIDRQKIVVHSPGTWNLESGPDFRRADLSIGGARLRGDIERHIEPAGWRLHNHSPDPRYDNVILHVTLMSRRGKAAGLDLPVSRHGVEIAETALWDCLKDDLKVLKCALRPDEYPYKSTKNYGRCRGLLEQTPPETAQRLLRVAGDARMIAKQRRFAYEAEKHDLDQVAYAATLEGMGYKTHTKQFARLAGRLSYARLRERVLSAGEKCVAGDGVRLTQALLLGAASLLPRPEHGDSPEAQEHIGLLRELWSDHGFNDLGEADIVWKAAAVRPANLPERRVAGAAHVVARSYEKGFFESILYRLLEADTKGARKMCIEFLTPDADEFWSRRYTAHGKRLARPVSLIGGDRALTIVVNSFVPLGLLHARSTGRDGDEELVHKFYCALPSLPPNNISRLMEYRMFGVSSGRRVARSAQTQQGLLQIFADWCSEDPSCEGCGIFAGLQSGYIRDKIQPIRSE